MVPTEEQPGAAGQQGSEKSEWQAQAWVYFIWVVVGFRVYCKVGCSSDPGVRLQQLQSGLPEEPFRMHLMPCLNLQQARLFERIFHAHLKEFRTRGDWFTDSNVKRLSRVISVKMREVLLLFESFEYESDIVQIDLGGKYPVLYRNGFVRDIVG